MNFNWEDNIVEAPLQLLDGGGGGGAPSNTPNDERIINEKLNNTSKWAKANSQDAKRDRIRFWSFKIPALIGTASTSALEAFGYGQAVIILGVVSAFFIAVDALYPGGQLFNVHRKAANELALLQHSVKDKWDQATLDHPDESPERSASVKDIIEYARAEYERINNYLTIAEASLGGEKK